MAALDFPSTGLTVGQKYPQPAVPGVPVYTWDGEKWTTVGGTIGSTGASDAIPQPDTPTGAGGSSTLWSRGDHAHPQDPLKVNKSGDTMTGHLSVPTAPAAANAVRKDYVDGVIAAIPAANIIINGDFRVNQVVYVSAAVLNAGAYGHDQWKAGAGGGNYSFTQLKSSTQITIASGKSLIQPIEDVNVVGGSYVLSWTGTAQARAGVNTLTPSGAYAASPLSIAGQTAGTAMSVEFNTGTLGTVKLEKGTAATPFVMQPYDQELVACQRYFQKLSFTLVGAPVASGNSGLSWLYSVPMRIAPTVTFAGSTITAIYSASFDGVNVYLTNGNPVIGPGTTADARL